MVVFTCNHCGESVQKPKVEKHSFSCRRSLSLTCVDCLKDFRDGEHVTHTKCITEEERYSAKGFKSKPNSNKGEKKQQEWIQHIQTILNREINLPKLQKHLLENLTKFENVPRKKNKFLNFINNSARFCNERDATKVYDLLEEEYKKTRSVQNGESNKQNGETNTQNGDANKQNGEMQLNKANENPNVQNKDTNNEFKWKKTILKIVKENKEIKKKKLAKRILKAYKNSNDTKSNQLTTDDEILALFDQKLIKMNKVVIDSNVVRLKQF